jgi:hypothetical protein
VAGSRRAYALAEEAAVRVSDHRLAMLRAVFAGVPDDERTSDEEALLSLAEDLYEARAQAAAGRRALAYLAALLTEAESRLICLRAPGAPCPSLMPLPVALRLVGELTRLFGEDEP